MGGKGGGGSKTQNVKQTTYTTNLPEYARPYFEGLLKQARIESERPYQAYQGQRIAGFDPRELSAFGIVEGIAGQRPRGLDEAYQLTEFAGTTPAAALQGERFSGEGVQRFMDPYLRNVLDVQQDMAQRRFQEGRLQRAQQSIGRGAFGGSRQAVAESLARRDLDEQLGAQQAKALSDAFRFGDL